MSSFKTPTTGIIGTHSGFDDDTGMHSYILENENTGDKETATTPYKPEDVRRLLNEDFNVREGNQIPGQQLMKTWAPHFKNLQSGDQRSFWKRVVTPTLRSIPAYFVGGPWDILGLLSYVPGPQDLAAMGYKAATEDDPFGMLEAKKKEGQRFRKGVQEKYGTQAKRKQFQQYLRAADRYAKENWNFEPFEAMTGTDMTPEARGIWERMMGSALEFGVSGPVMMKGITLPPKVLQEGARFIFSRMAKDSANELGEAALKPENFRSLIDKAHDAYSVFTKQGRRNIKAEAAFGAVAGPMTEGSLHLLEKADPNAAGWVKMLTAIGSGIAGPIAARGVWTGLLQGPAIRTATRVIIDPVLRPTRSATGFVQQHLGGASGDRAAIASTSRLLEEAVADGRHVHEASGLAFTTPELARSEANILRAQIQLKRERLSEETDPKVRDTLQKEIEADSITVGNLNRTATFYENVLESAARDQQPGVAARFFQSEARRLVERRDQFFNYIEGRFKRSLEDLDFGGRPGGTLKEHNSDYASVKNEGATPEFEATRRKLVMEGEPQGVEASELLWLDPQTRVRAEGIKKDLSSEMNKAFRDAQNAAEGRVKFWEDQVQKYLANRGLKNIEDLPEVERLLVGDLIRGTYDDAAREWRAFEGAAWKRIKGIDEKVTENVVFPKGSRDPVDDSDISGMTVEEWAISRFDKLSPTEAFNMKLLPPQLAQLAGSRSVIALLNRRRSEAGAAGRAQSAQSRIPDLEKRRDDFINQRAQKESEYDTLRETESAQSFEKSRELNDYIDRASTGWPSPWKTKKSIDDFQNNPDINWSTINAATARSYAGASDLGPIFVEVAKRKKEIANLGEGVTQSGAARKLSDEIENLSNKATKAQDDIDRITQDFLNLEEGVQVPATGRLTARTPDGELVRGGTSATDVKEFISELEDAARIEKAANGTTVKYRNIRQIRETLDQLLDSRTFRNLNPGELSLARETSRVKRSVDDAQDTTLEKTKGSEVKVEVEVLPETVLPPGASAAANAAKLRKLRESTAEVPDFVTITRGEDGVPVAVIDEDALAGGSALFDRADSPFEMVSVGQAGTPFEIRLRPDAVVSDRSLKVAESIILERLALTFPDGVDSRRLQTFRENNKAAIKFLENNGRADVPALLNNADGLATQLDALASLRQDKTKTQLTELVNSGALDLQGRTIDDFLEYIGNRRKRISENIAFAEVLRSDPGRAMDKLFDVILEPKNSRPKKDIQQFLSIVRENKQAEKGLQASIIGQIWARSLSTSDSLLKEAGDLSFKAFDPVKFRELVADPRIRTLIQEAFPDNPSLIDDLEDFSKTAFETSNFTTGPSGSVAIKPSESVNLSGWAFLGRVSALGVANKAEMINQLWAGGAGSQLGKALGRKVTGAKIKDIVIEGALNPEKGAQLGLQASDQLSGLGRTLGQASIDVINVPGAIMNRPAASAPVLLRGEDELDAVDEPGSVGPQSSVAPAAPPPVRYAMRNRGVSRDIVPNSSLAGAGARPLGASAQTIARMSQLGIPLFRGSHGGYVGGAGSGVGRLQESEGIMSVRRKGRQLVG